MLSRLIIIFLVIFGSIGDFQNKPLTLEYLNSVDAICTIKVISKELDDKFTFQVERVFKGRFQNPNISIINLKGYAFLETDRYLIFADQSDDMSLSLNTSSRIIPINESASDIDFLLKNIKCFDETRKGTIKGACTREYTLMCACDGKDYGNPCEAYKQGLNIFSFGKCKE